eukprot:11173775-Lingulodinium_polyedra.AAC.1
MAQRGSNVVRIDDKFVDGVTDDIFLDVTMTIGYKWRDWRGGSGNCDRDGGVAKMMIATALVLAR